MPVDEHLQISEEDVKTYYQLQEQKKEIDKQIKQFHEKFHRYFDTIAGEYQKGEIQIGEYKVQRQIRQSTVYEEEKTVQLLEQLQLHDLIQIIKKPDEEKIESAIALGLIDRRQMEECKKVKKTKAIVVKKM